MQPTALKSDSPQFRRVVDIFVKGTHDLRIFRQAAYPVSLFFPFADRYQRHVQIVFPLWTFWLMNVFFFL
jgi:hypothetical protein